MPDAPLSDSILNRVNLGRRFTFSALLRATEAIAGKEITFISWPFPPAVTGAKLQSEDRIYVFYAQGVAPVYELLIKIHELIHILLGREDACAAGEASVIDAVRHSLAVYGTMVDGLVLRSIGGAAEEWEIDEAAVALLERLVPERVGHERSLAEIVLD